MPLTYIDYGITAAWYDIDGDILYVPPGHPLAQTVKPGTQLAAELKIVESKIIVEALQKEADKLKSAIPGLSPQETLLLQARIDELSARITKLKESISQPPTPILAIGAGLLALLALLKRGKL